MHMLRNQGPKISDFTVRRLSTYYRILEDIEAKGMDVISSAALADLAGTNSAQIRKDLSYFGTFGKRGRGYQVSALKSEIKSILGLQRSWKVVLAGAGNLGHALCSYKDFSKHGFEIVAVFDVDPSKVGQSWDGVRIRHIDEASVTIQSTGAELAIVADSRHGCAGGLRSAAGGRDSRIPQFRPREDRYAEITPGCVTSTSRSSSKGSPTRFTPPASSRLRDNLEDRCSSPWIRRKTSLPSSTGSSTSGAIGASSRPALP